MTREEWKEVIGNAEDEAYKEYLKSERFSTEENNIRIIRKLLKYIYDAL